MTLTTLAMLAQGSSLIPLLVVGGVILLAVIVVAGMYNGLVRARNACDESWADIDTELRRRYDLIPNLIETVKGYAAHEKETLERVIQARNAAMNNHGTPEEQAKDENVLVGALRQVFALAENYPDLKANQNFLAVQEELTSTENKIAFARQNYNDQALMLNNKIQMVPSNIVAGMFAFREAEFFELEDEAAREVPRVDFS